MGGPRLDSGTVCLAVRVAAVLTCRRDLGGVSKPGEREKRVWCRWARRSSRLERPSPVSGRSSVRVLVHGGHVRILCLRHVAGLVQTSAFVECLLYSCGVVTEGSVATDPTTQP